MVGLTKLAHVASLLVALTECVAAGSKKSTTLQPPNIVPHPHHPGGRLGKPQGARSGKVCNVSSPKNTEDDAPAIFAALKKCNHGGTVVLNDNYTIASALDLTFLADIDIAIQGTINFSDDIDYWVESSFKYTFQNSSTFWKWGGSNVNIYGNGIGTINGNGQNWWAESTTNSTLLRPILMVTDGLHDSTISGIHFKNSPNWNLLLSNSTSLLVSDIAITVKGENGISPKNTDGFDTIRSDNIVIQDSTIDNTDDCVSFKPNSTNIVVQNLVCNGSHGVSVGSLGQYVGETDIAENIYVYNVSMSNASDGIRLKVWPGANPKTGATDAGGGDGYVKNVTYEVFHNTNNDWAIEINQCYGVSNVSVCEEYPSEMVMSDVLIKNVTGTTSKKHDPDVGTLVCSASDKCINFVAENINVTPPSGKAPLWICSGFDTSGLEGFDCVAPS